METLYLDPEHETSYPSKSKRSQLLAPPGRTVCQGRIWAIFSYLLVTMLSIGGYMHSVTTCKVVFNHCQGKPTKTATGPVHEAAIRFSCWGLYGSGFMVLDVRFSV